MILPNGGLPRKRGNPAAARYDRRCGVMNRPCQGQPAMFPFRQGFDKCGEEYDRHIQSQIPRTGSASCQCVHVILNRMFYSVLQKRKLYRYWEYLLFYKGVYLRCADIKKMPTVFCTKLRSTNIRSRSIIFFRFLHDRSKRKVYANSLAMLKILICFVLVILVSMFSFFRKTR